MIFRLFEGFGLVSLLTLKLTKCVIISSACTTSKRNVDMIRAYIRCVVPSWAAMSFKDAANYCGLFCGRLAGALQ